MLKGLSAVVMTVAFCWSAHAVEQRHGILVGTVVKVDNAAKTVIVKVADGAEHAFHVVNRTMIHGGQDTATGAKDAFHGLKAGSEVAVHYTGKGSQETAQEIDRIGKDGLKSTEGTVSSIDRSGKVLTLKTASGAQETYRLTDSAAKDAGKDISSGAEKSARVTVYYTEEAGHKIAHFFKRAV